MKICLRCDAQFSRSNWTCPVCGFDPLRKGHCVVLLRDELKPPRGYDVAYFPELAALEDHNFWFRARTRLITWAIAKYFPTLRTYLEIGCGTGCVLAGVAAAFPAVEMSASEPFTEGLAFAQKRVPRAEFLQLDARAIPFSAEFDLIGAFDVLEHIDDDVKVLRQMHQAVAPGGGILLTVPQHNFLWSRQDVAAGHVRRYQAADLREKLTLAGFRIRRMTSFVSVLLPAMLVSRSRKNSAGLRFDPLDELRIGPGLNSVMEFLLDLERATIRAGLSLPIGGSLLVAADKT